MYEKRARSLRTDDEESAACGMRAEGASALTVVALSHRHLLNCLQERLIVLVNIMISRTAPEIYSRPIVMPDSDFRNAS